MYSYNTIIKIYDVDAAGILFFANQFRLVYDAYESYLEDIGYSVKKIINEADFLLPVVSAKTDYKVPLFVGDNISVNIEVKTIGESSVTLAHKIYKEKKILAGEGETVHVSIDKKTGKKLPFPKELKDLLLSV